MRVRHHFYFFLSEPFTKSEALLLDADIVYPKAWDSLLITEGLEESASLNRCDKVQ